MKPQHAMSLSTVPFPLYHGTSSHYLDAFQVGQGVEAWPFKAPAFELLQETWRLLSALGTEPDWMIRNVLSQTSERSNWQHGELYLTANLRRAAMYANSGADYGGEFLRMCKEGLAELERLNMPKAAALQKQFRRLEHLLSGGGKPIVVQFVGVRVADLTNEIGGGPADDAVQRLLAREGELREVLSQVTNFRLRLGSSPVHRRWRIQFEDPNDSEHSPFAKIEEGLHSQ